MAGWLTRVGCGAVLGCGLAALPLATAQDEKKAAVAKEPPAKAPTWSDYARDEVVVTAPVETADENGVTIQTIKLSKSGGGRGKVKAEPDEKTFTYTPDGMVRWKKLPAKTDDSGKKSDYTEAEREKRRQPLGVPGYSADRGDLHAGQTVELHLVRPKSVPKEKAAETDFQIKYVLILTDPAIGHGVPKESGAKNSPAKTEKPEPKKK